MAAQAGLCLAWSETPEDTVCHGVAQIENGRFSKKPIDDRTCKKCFRNQIEDEMHFICDCSFYNSERAKFFDYIRDTIPSFACLNSLIKWFS